MGMGAFQQEKTKKCQAPIELPQPFAAPEFRADSGSGSAGGGGEGLVFLWKGGGGGTGKATGKWARVQRACPN